MKQRQTATITAFLCLLSLTMAIASVNAETVITNRAGYFQTNLDKWGWAPYNMAQTYTTLTPFNNFTATFDWTGLVATNATSLHGYNFYLLTSSEATTGYVAKLNFNQQAGETIADYRNCSLDICLVDNGAETIMTTLYNAHNFKAILDNQTQTISFYVDSIKVYQQTSVTGQLLRVGWTTIDMPITGNNNEGAFTTGYVSITVVGAGTGTISSSFNTAGVTTLLSDIMPLIMGIVMISIVVGVVAIVPKMMRRIKV